MSKNSVLDDFKSQKISSHPESDVLESVLKVRNAWVKVEWVEREEELSIIRVEVMVEGSDGEYFKIHVFKIVF